MIRAPARNTARTNATAIQRQPIGAQTLIFDHHHYFIEKCVHALPCSGEESKCRNILPILPVCLHSGTVRFNVCCKIFLFVRRIIQVFE